MKNRKIHEILRSQAGSGEPAFKVCCNCLKTVVDAYSLRQLAQEFDSTFSFGDDDSKIDAPMLREAQNHHEGVVFCDSAGRMASELTVQHSAPPFYYPMVIPGPVHSGCRVPMQEQPVIDQPEESLSPPEQQEEEYSEDYEPGSPTYEDWADADWTDDDTVFNDEESDDAEANTSRDSLDLKPYQAFRMIHMRPVATSSQANLIQEPAWIDPASFLENQVSEVKLDEEDFEEDDDEIVYAISIG